MVIHHWILKYCDSKNNHKINKLTLNLWKIMSYVHFTTLEKIQNFTEFHSPTIFSIFWTHLCQSQHRFQQTQRNSSYFNYFWLGDKPFSLYYFFIFLKQIPSTSWTQQEINSTIEHIYLKISNVDVSDKKTVRSDHFCTAVLLRTTLSSRFST